MENKQSKSTLVHDAIMLFVITLVAGILLGIVYNMTEKTIAKAEEDATNEAYKQVYADGNFQANDELTDKLEKFQEKVTKGEVDDDAFSYTDVTLIEARTAEASDGNGFVLKVSGKGYGGAVTIVLGVSSEGEVKGIQILDASNETPGLGQNSTKESWNKQYVGVNSENPLQVVKDGSGSAENGTINSISGATITSSAVTRAVNVALKFVGEQK